jgi:predicted dehydrogenase/threonine dehydrogenase-like Zn-dependent dehydrogenase
MKQVLQNFQTGAVTVEDVPPPVVRAGAVLVRNRWSLISAGTEGGTVRLGQMSLIGKARARPEQVRKVLQVARTEGWLTAYRAAMRSLAMPIALGYCSAGEVVEVGRDVTDLRVGDRVACGGGGQANHAEVVAVARNLCVPVPVSVDLRSAAFATLGAVATQSVRIADVRFGENVVVIGLGLVGLLTAQILRAAGCNVFGIDVDEGRVTFAREQAITDGAARGAPNLEAQVASFTGGHGADAIVITAAAPTNDPVALAGDLARYRARVVVVGRTEMNAPRETYLFKELTLATSLAYGPGTGDPTYEEHGVDYPIGYVRWTENRNMAAFLQLVGDGRIRLDPLVSHEFDVADAPRAFDVVTGRGGERSIAVVLRYPEHGAGSDAGRITLTASARPAGGPRESVRVGVIGAGSFATNVMLPILAATDGVRLAGIASATGVRAQALGKKYGFGYCASDARQILDDPDVDCVFVLTRHDTHAALAEAALDAGKHVFVEKPLAMNAEEIDRVVAAQRRSGQNVLVGFNRPFAPLAIRMKEFFGARTQPMSVVYRANVGYRPPGHWLHDPAQGGGVIVGEACHFIDFCRWLVGAAPLEVTARSLTSADDPIVAQDNVHVTITFSDGSLATVAYVSTGDASISRERVEACAEGALGVLEDFNELICVRRGRRRRMRRRLSTDRGHAAAIAAFIAAVRAGDGSPVALEDVAASMLATFAAVESARSGDAKRVGRVAAG